MQEAGNRQVFGEVDTVEQEGRADVTEEEELDGGRNGVWAVSIGERTAGGPGPRRAGEEGGACIRRRRHMRVIRVRAAGVR